MKTFKSYLKEGLEDVRRANREKENALRKSNRDKESSVRKAEQDKDQKKRRAEREKNIEKQLAKNNKEESIVQKVKEYIEKNGKRRKCAGGDGRRKESKEKKTEASGDKEAYQKFFNAKLKKYGVSSPEDLKGADKKKFYDEIDAEWEGDNEND